jgi:outer membrane protein
MVQSVCRSRLSACLALLMCASPIPAAPQAPGADNSAPRGGLPRGSLRVRPVSFENSPRLHTLIRSGNLYLSLSDALALAIENNLDIELQRFSLPAADTDLLRAQGGGILRGVPFILAETPAGVGGPLSPLVTNPATSSSVNPGSAVATNAADLGLLGEAQTNLSVQGTLPQSNGTPIAIADPALVGQLNWAHQTTPQTNNVVTGTNSLI